MNTYVGTMLGDNEIVMLQARRHWFSLFRMIFVELLLILFAPVVIGFATVSKAVGAWAYLLVLIPIGSLIHDVLVHWNHVYVITNRRVIQFSGLINKRVIDSSIEKVNDIRMEQTFFGRIFDYGDIEILTANEIGENKFKMIAKPIFFKTTLLNAREAYGFDDDGVKGKSRSTIPTLLTELDDLRKKGILTETEFEEKKAELMKKL
jgi:uncharacterized membrane protein YdbT with pleckstrin-like domain